jgi:histone H3
LTPPVDGADLRAALVASCFRGAFPPVDLRAVCLVRAIFKDKVEVRLLKAVLMC